MNRKLISELSGEISYAEILPGELAGYQVPGEPYSVAVWENGTSLYQEIDWGIHIRYTNYMMQDDDRLHIIDDRPLLALQFILGNSFYGDWRDLGRRIDHEASFNFFYVPGLDQSLDGWKGERAYSKVEFLFPIHQLMLLAPHFPMLEQLLERAEQGKPTLMNSSNQIASSDMLAGVRQILHNSYSRDVKILYAEAKGMTTLINALEAFNRNKNPVNTPRLAHYEAEQVYQAKDILLENMDCNFTLASLATEVGANKFRLNNGFKEIYGVSVFDFLLNARMEKAQFLLVDTRHSMDTIAWLTGYSDAYSFSRAFKRYFGVSPRRYRARPFLSLLRKDDLS
jgi:AraC-like DNA-binding protein